METCVRDQQLQAALALANWLLVPCDNIKYDDACFTHRGHPSWRIAFTSYRARLRITMPWLRLELQLKLRTKTEQDTAWGGERGGGGGGGRTGKKGITEAVRAVRRTARKTLPSCSVTSSPKMLMPTTQRKKTQFTPFSILLCQSIRMVSFKFSSHDPAQTHSSFRKPLYMLVLNGNGLLLLYFLLASGMG